jgi:hypothetical protein
MKGLIPPKFFSEYWDRIDERAKQFGQFCFFAHLVRCICYPLVGDANWSGTPISGELVISYLIVIALLIMSFSDYMEWFKEPKDPIVTQE